MKKFIVPFIFAVSLVACSTPEVQKPMNILLIMGDDCSAQEIGCYGHPEHKTPNIDKLASTGVMFKTAWCTPLCSPTRSELMTGRYGFRTGWYHNDMKKNVPLSTENELFSEIVKAAGYKTVMAGKWQLPGMPPEYKFDENQLWAYESYWPEGTVYTGGYESFDSTKYNFMKPSRYWHPSIVRNDEYIPSELNDYGPDKNTDFVIDFMARNKDLPFLVYYSMVITHDPFFPTPASLDDTTKRWIDDKPANFKANVEYMDHLVGRMVKALDSLGLRENTILIFTTDNGTVQVGKGQSTELGCRVPLVVNCPGTVKALGPRDELIDFTDISPSIAEFTGTSMPEGYVHDGKSFAPLLLGKPYKEREWIFSYLAYDRMLRDKRWLLEGDGSFFDCGNSRDGKGYVDVTDSDDPEVKAARARFEKILADKPAPEKKK